MKTARLLLLLIVCSTAALTQAETVVPHTFEDGTPAEASEVNENFDALADKSNEDDARITTVEVDVAQNQLDITALQTASEGHYLPYWFDANGKNLGMYIEGVQYSLVRVEGIDYPIQSPENLLTSQIVSDSTFWTGTNCSGEGYFGQSSYKGAKTMSGFGKLGIVIRDPLTTNESEVVTLGIARYNRDQVECLSSSSRTWAAGELNPVIQTTMPPDQDAVRPYVIKWSASGQPPYPID
jgi:hypothetical protein